MEKTEESAETTSTEKEASSCKAHWESIPLFIPYKGGSFGLCGRHKVLQFRKITSRGIEVRTWSKWINWGTINYILIQIN